MSDFELVNKIKKLPFNYKLDANNLVDYLLKKKFSKNKKKDVSEAFGSLRGKIKMLPGFDDPIEGMEEYM
jgi:hypothetical protein